MFVEGDGLVSGMFIVKHESLSHISISLIKSEHCGTHLHPLGQRNRDRSIFGVKQRPILEKAMTYKFSDIPCLKI